MHFDVEAVAPDRFAAWVDATRGSGSVLSAQSYAELARQSTNVAPFTFRDVEPDLFQRIVSQALPPGPGPVEETNPGASRRAEN
jgi:cytochrome o ubiquinol oxidase subunit 2